MSMTLRPATFHDVPMLVQMNQELIEDEGSSNPMTQEKLESRMRRWLQSWEVLLFVQDIVVVGYVIYRIQKNDHDATETVYIRHYFISREFRRQGLGREAFVLLQSSVFPKNTKIYLEVLWHNQRGRDFWQSMGFNPYSITLKLV
jgi:ribosomal protein S18 acetylase RimI-like enzyme